MSKINRSHTTYIEQAEYLLKFLNTNDKVTKISLGIISIKSPPSKTMGPTKITITKNHILLEVNSKASNQEIHVFGNNLQKLAEEIARFIRNENKEIKFGRHFKMAR